MDFKAGDLVYIPQAPKVWASTFSDNPIRHAKFPLVGIIRQIKSLQHGPIAFEINGYGADIDSAINAGMVKILKSDIAEREHKNILKLVS